MTSQFEALKDKHVAVLMSAGVDSHTVLFSALAAKKRVTVYAFTLEDRESRDFKIARNTAEVFKLKFVPVLLPTDVNTLVSDVKFMIKHGCYKKTHIECFWPMMYAVDAVRERHIGTGHGADNYYCLSRKANQHYKGRADEYRAMCFDDPLWSQKKFIQEYSGHRFIYQYHQREVFDVFHGMDPAVLNKPHQKSVSREAFASYFEKCKVYNHMPFQLGDSGIAKHFELLLNTKYNKHNYKSVVGIYNDLRRSYEKFVATKQRSVKSI